MDMLPKCQVCNEHFTLKGPAPYLLPCLHVVCETCVTSTAGGVITCSTCQVVVNLTETQLQKDVVRQREIIHLTVQRRPSEILCTHEDDGNQAVCWCHECEEFLCEHCQNLHESFKANKRHTVDDIGEIKPRSLDQDEFCNSHSKHICDFWDHTCRRFICARCRFGDHADHKVQEISDAVKEMTPEMESQGRLAKEAAENQNSLLLKTREQLTCTNESVSALGDKTIFTFSSLKTLLEQREKELLVSLQQYADRTKSHLDSKALGFSSANLKCKMAAEYTQKALLYCSKYDLLKLKEMIGETTQVCLTSAESEKWEDIPQPVFIADGLERLKSSMAVFGKIDTTNNISAVSTETQDHCSHTEVGYLSNLEELEDQLKKQVDLLQYELMKSQSETKKMQTVVKNVTDNQEQEEIERRGMECEFSGLSEASTYDRDLLQGEISRHRKTITSLEAQLVEYMHTAKRLQLTLREISMALGSTRHFLMTVSSDKSFILQCIQLKFDRDRFNINTAHITTDGELVNTKQLAPHDQSKVRLVKYDGTTSTAPLPWCGSPQYWEVRGRVGINKTLTGNNLLLEIGLCIEEERDQHHCIDVHPHSYSLTVSHCTTHSSICRKVWKHGKHVLCTSDTLPNTPGHSTTLQFGVVLDDSRCRVVFIDLNTNKVVYVIDEVDCSQPLWPMLGVYNDHLASVSLSLVVGNDIDMTEEKKAMILKSLS